jgi:opacity protein-like surface antigen
VAAQDAPRATAAGGYTYLREQGPAGFDPETYPSGWAAAVTFRVAGRLSAAGEVGVSSRTNPFDEHAHLLAALGGARFDLWRTGRTQVFVQGLAGVERFSEPGLSESGFAFQLGAGADIPVWKSWFARAQADYRRASQTAGSFNELRLFLGGGFAFR